MRQTPRGSWRSNRLHLGCHVTIYIVQYYCTLFFFLLTIKDRYLTVHCTGLATEVIQPTAKWAVTFRKV